MRLLVVAVVVKWSLEQSVAASVRRTPSRLVLAVQCPHHRRTPDETVELHPWFLRPEPQLHLLQVAAVVLRSARMQQAAHRQVDMPAVAVDRGRGGHQMGRPAREEQPSRVATVVLTGVVKTIKAEEAVEVPGWRVLTAHRQLVVPVVPVSHHPYPERPRPMAVAVAVASVCPTLEVLALEPTVEVLVVCRLLVVRVRMVGAVAVVAAEQMVRVCRHKAAWVAPESSSFAIWCRRRQRPISWLQTTPEPLTPTTSHRRAR